MSTFNDAYNKRNCPTGLMFHSDRGTQYTAAPFKKLLDKLDVVQSFFNNVFLYKNNKYHKFNLSIASLET